MRHATYSWKGNLSILDEFSHNIMQEEEEEERKTIVIEENHLQYLRMSIIEVVTARVVVDLMNIIEVGCLGVGTQLFWSSQIIRSINYLNILEVTRFSRSFIWEMTIAHLSGGVFPIWLRVNYFTTRIKSWWHCLLSRKIEVLTSILRHWISKLYLPVPFFWILLIHNRLCMSIKCQEYDPEQSKL